MLQREKKVQLPLICSGFFFFTLSLLSGAIHSSFWERDKINNVRGGLKAGPQSVADVFWRRNT